MVLRWFNSVIPLFKYPAIDRRRIFSQSSFKLLCVLHLELFGLSLCSQCVIFSEIARKLVLLLQVHMVMWKLSVLLLLCEGSCHDVEQTVKWPAINDTMTMIEWRHREENNVIAQDFYIGCDYLVTHSFWKIALSISKIEFYSIFPTISEAMR